MTVKKNIIAAIDFSEVSEVVVETAVEIAHANSHHLWIVHVAAPDPEYIGYKIGPQHERDWRASNLHSEHIALQDKAKSLQNLDLDVTSLLIQGPTVQALLAEAHKLNANFIVVGSHGHGALYKILAGSVTHELLKLSSCPVVVVPSCTENSSLEED